MAIAGAALGTATGFLLHPALGVAMGIVGAINGAICGWCRTYAWRRVDGMVAFVLDSTWAALPVALGLLAHLGARLQRDDPGHEWSLGHRQNRHVYRRGVALKAGFAFTIGNVISGAGDVDRPRRRRLVTDHEDVHVWQSRWFGPLYPVLYGLWSLAALAVAAVVWAARGRRQPLAKVVESFSYYTNPFEWWAYSRDDLWPPPGKLEGIGWHRAAARPLATLPRRVRRADAPTVSPDAPDGGAAPAPSGDPHAH